MSGDYSGSHTRCARRRKTGTGSRQDQAGVFANEHGGRVPVPIFRAVAVRCGGNGDRHLRFAAEPVPVFASALGSQTRRTVCNPTVCRSNESQNLTPDISDTSRPEAQWPIRRIRVPGYLHAAGGADAGDERERRKQDAELGRELGFEMEFLGSVPFVGTPGVRVPNQAKFHPLKYLARLLDQIPGKPSHIFEHTEVTEVEDDPLVVKANGHSIHCHYLVIATHVPLMGKAGQVSAALFQSKLASYSSYAIGVKAKRGAIPEALFWDTASPYHYLRADEHPRHVFVILGGEDHKTGQEDDPEGCFRALAQSLEALLPEGEINYQWSGQVVETNDGLPLIGETSERQFAATGFAGNGMTFGTLAAMMACDAARRMKNPWRDLFDVHRKKLSSTWDYLRENLDHPYYMIKDRLSSTEGNTTRGLKPGMGKILTLKGRRVAAYRDPKGKLVTLSPICTHLGCLVSWNKTESTWDCPCHGSRFKPNGHVLAGPAESPLEPVSLDEEE
ncbi:FAD-dependent oxidoreductase [Singulisphaera rosea]